MRSFKDTEGRQWVVRVSVDTLKRVKALLGVDLTEAATGDLMGRLADDPVLLADVLYAVCQPEAEGRDISDEAFGRALGGDAIDEAADALIGALVDFFPKRRRALLEKAKQKLDGLNDVTVGLALERLDDPALEQRLREKVGREMDEAMDEAMSGKPSTASPASPASSPAR